MVSSALQPIVHSPPAEPEYKFLKNLNIKRIDTPDPSNEDYAETWPAGEKGTSDRPRPSEIPLNQNGVQVFKPDQFDNKMMAGEALHIDPVAQRYQQQFAATLTPDQIKGIKEDNDYKQANTDEAAKMRSGVASIMRGYLVGQWPKEEIDKFLTPAQKTMLDQLGQYMRTGQDTMVAPK